MKGDIMSDAQATFSLYHKAGSKPLLPEELEEKARRVLDRVENKTGLKSIRMNVLKNIGHFVVFGPASLMLEILKDEEVFSMLGRPD